jgi:transcriptional antiterminator RfaH
MIAMVPSRYAVRTNPKHEHIATANLRRHSGMALFFPKISLEKLVRCCLVRVVESLFPCYVFVHCVVEEQVSEIQHTSGVRRLVQFGDKFPPVSNAFIEELLACFGVDELLAAESRLVAGDEVTVATGAFAGMSAQVLKSLPAKKRVQILLDMVGRSTPVEVGSEVVFLTGNTLAALARCLAAQGGHERFRV